MTQHIIIRINPKGTEPPYVPYPEVASVWRDDQTVTWMLQPGQGLYWDPEPGQTPVFFLPEDETHSAWPGMTPAPIGDLSGTEDKRTYVALGGVVLNPGEQPVTYHWAAWVNGPSGRHRLQTLHPEQVGTLVDPDLVNQPQP
jgi:hypothetical protein